RKKLLSLWHEKRKYSLYSRGDKSKQGNLNTRILLEEQGTYLRINVGDRTWIKAKVIRDVKRKNDKWISFISSLLISEKTNKYFPYSIEIKIRDNEVYAFISYEEQVKDIEITKKHGVIGIDINASPFHLALAEVDTTGNLVSYQSISLHNLLNKTRNQRNYLAWQIAHEIINIAKEKNKAIVIERLSTIDKGKKGDGNKVLRKKLQKWVYRGILERIKVLARRSGIEVIEVNPAYTSIIGMLKYSPQYNIDKDIAGAYVIGRKGLGFKERLPENYEKILKSKEYMEYAINKLEDIKKSKEDKLNNENNTYKQKPIKKEIKQIKQSIKLLKNLSSESLAQKPVNQRKEQVRGQYWTDYKQWQVAKVALILPILGKSFNRDFSPLKSYLVDWDRSVSRLVPLLGAGTIADSKYRLSGMSQLEMAEYKYPDLKCSETFQLYTL
ncbi:MAG: IS200/IS605 family accessory protein TnpB-related protein, partial [Hydrogenothermaceae bacterium]